MMMEMMLAEEADWSEWEMMMEMILAEDTTAARPAVSTTAPPSSDEPDTKPMMGGGMGGYGGNPEPLGYGGYAPAYGTSRVKDTKESYSPDSNTPAPSP